MQQYPQGPQGYPYYAPYPSPHGDAPGTPGAQPPQASYTAPLPTPSAYPSAGPYSYSYTPSPPYPVYHSPETQSAKNTAIASMVLGIVGLCVVPLICSIIALALGVSAKKTLAKGMDGYGMAQAGFVMGIIGLSFWGLYVLSILSSLSLFL